jgi:dihydrofolate reductase
MRKLLASAFVSLDGVMQAPGGPEEDPSGGFAFGGWTVPFWEGDEALGAAMDRLFEAPFALLLGRRTYEIFAAFWPYADDEIARLFNPATKYVATSSDAPLAWNGSVALRGDIPAEVARLKQEDGPDLLIQGSSVLLHAMLAHRLIDELTLLTFPLVLGKGKKWYDEAAAPAALELFDSAVSAKGVTIARYRPAGEVRTGSFAAEQPSEAEIDRREKLREEDHQGIGDRPGGDPTLVMA